MNDLEYKKQILDPKSASFCGAKWYNATIWLGSGMTTSCHHPLPHKIDLEENPALKESVVKDTELKEWLVNYVGNKKDPEDGNVTVEMILEVMATDFPEFLLPLAEENFIRGYHQALDDVTANQQQAQFVADPVSTAAKAKKTKKRVSRKKKK